MNDEIKFTCPCYDVSGDSFRELITRGVTDVKKIQELTGAGLGCGMCEDRMFMVIREAVDNARSASPSKECGNA
ncbi:MAG: hypothetical protein DELT_00291 [Desulfovibrio sp.]